MKNKIIILLFLLIANLSAQTIKINFSDDVQQSATLLSVEGEKTNFVDSIKTKTPGSFQFDLNAKKNHSGLYRLKFTNTKWLDFIWDNEDIEISTNYNSILDSLKIVQSESAKLFYEYVNLTKEYKTKSELLELILTRYPKDDIYYEQTEQRLNELQYDYSLFVNSTSQSNPESFIARYIRSSQLPIVSADISTEKRLDYLKEHALDFVDFNDAGLINSDCFSNKAIEYLMYYRNPQLPKELLEQEFIKSVNILLDKAKVNINVYQHLTEYLIDGFKKFGFDLIVDYIIENYVIKDDLCLDQELETSIERRMKQAKLLPVGVQAPQINLNEPDGIDVNLYAIPTEKTLVLFYSSQCPHCRTIIPKLSKLYKNQKEKKIEVLAVSLDEDESEWIDFLNQLDLTWYNVSDLKGWSGKTARDYFIYATPTMFLLDKDKNIIAKPTTITDLKEWF